MFNFIIFYIFGFLVFCNILYAWYNTTISEKILSIILNKKNETLMYNDLLKILEEKNEFISELLSCPICLGSWISFIISIIIYNIIDLELYYILFCTFSWPTLCYKFFFK